MTQPSTGVLLVAYGTPDTLDDVAPYYTHIRGGRAPAPDKLETLRARYRAIGGHTPLLALTVAVRDELQSQLDASSPDQFRVFIGMKHWHPYIAEVMPEVLASGIQRLIVIALAPHYSRISIGGYRRAVEEALAGVDAAPEVTFIERWHDHPDFRQFMAARVQAGLAQFPQDARGEVTVLFSAHSLPERIRTWNDPYPDELLDSARGVAELAGISDWRFAFQSAGMTGETWLGPDILQTLTDLAAEGKRTILAVPIGFVAEHLEVLYDIDIECQAKARELGITLKRTELPNADPAFVAVLADLARSQMPVGQP